MINRQEYLDWEREAENGSSGAMYKVAGYLLRGEGCEKDVDKAVEWFTKLEKKGVELDKETLCLVGNMYLSGEGCVKDIVKGVDYLKRSGREVPSSLQNKIKRSEGRIKKEVSRDESYKTGEMYLLGEGCEKDVSKALEWFIDSKMNIPDSYYNELGMNHRKVIH